MKIFDLLSDILNNGDKPIDATALQKLQREIEGMTKTMDDANKFVVDLEDAMRQLTIAGKENSREYRDMEKLLEKHRKTLEETNAELDNTLIEAAKAHNVSIKNLREQIESFDSLQNAVNNSSSGTNKLTGSVKKFFGGLSSSLGDSGQRIQDLSKILKGDLVFAAIMAGKQLIELNDRLVRFAREQSGSLNARQLGFDIYGNSTTARVGNLQSIAGNNGLEIDEFLQTFKAFSQGQIIGMTDNLNESQDALKNYGVEVGRISKLYGVSSGTLANLGQSLTYNFGYSINETTKILKSGASAAASAGINIQNFFSTLQDIANLQGQLFINGGAEGLTKTAGVLAKLGLSANILERVAERYTSFGDLVDRQNRAAGLGFVNYSGAQSSMFASAQLGNTDKLVQTQQLSLARDVSRLGYVNNGQINNAGLNTLKSLGVSQEEIKSLQRLINMQNKLGASYEDVINETNLSTEQLKKKRIIEQEEMTIGEKLNVIWNKIYNAILAPFVTILAPAFDIVINSLSLTFSALNAVMKPILFAFQILGRALTKISDEFAWVTKSISSFLDNLGLGEGGQATLDKIVDVLSDILKYVILLWGTSKLLSGLGALKNGITSLTGMLSGGVGSLGKNLIRGAMGAGTGNLFAGMLPSWGGGAAKALTPSLKGLGKGLGVGAALGIAGDLGSYAAGEMGASEKTQNLIGQTGEYAGYGAMIGSIIPGVGTAVGAGIGGLIGFLKGEFWDKYEDVADRQAKKQQSNIKIASMAANGAPSISAINQAMAGRRYTSPTSSESEMINDRLRDGGKNPIIQVNVKPSLLGNSPKAKITGYG